MFAIRDAVIEQTFGLRLFEIMFTLPAAPLLTWDGWNGGVRKWILGQGEAVPIAEVVDTYARIAGQFAEWLRGRIGLKYQIEIRDFLAEREEFDRKFRFAFGA